MSRRLRFAWMWTVHALASIPVALVVCDIATKRADRRRDHAYAMYLETTEGDA